MSSSTGHEQSPSTALLPNDVQDTFPTPGTATSNGSSQAIQPQQSDVTQEQIATSPNDENDDDDDDDDDGEDDGEGFRFRGPFTAPVSKGTRPAKESDKSKQDKDAKAKADSKKNPKVDQTLTKKIKKT